jgi:multiple sugar transport system permease protein
MTQLSRRQEAAVARASFADRSTERSNISAADLRRPGVRWTLRIVITVVVGFLAIATAGPLVWLLKSALSTSRDINSAPFGFFPSGVQWENFATAWNQIHISQYTLNSIAVTSGEVVVGLIVAISGGYTLAVLKPKWGPFLNGAIMATLFVPVIISLIPLYLTIIDFHLIDTYWAIWLTNGVSAFNVLIFRQYFSSLPPEIFEAARIDGAGHFRVLVSIVLPLSKPILGVGALLMFTASWKDFLWPLLALPSPDKQPLSVGLSKAADTADQAVLLAGMFITVLIPIALFLVFQKQFLRGAGSAGAIKG